MLEHFGRGRPMGRVERQKRRQELIAGGGEEGKFGADDCIGGGGVAW